MRNESDTDFCFIHKDGSYAVFYLDAENQHYAIHVGQSIEKVTADLNDGYDIILDSNGYPQVVKRKEYTIYFSNFSGNTFDAAIDYNGEIQYLWGLQVDIDFDDLNSLTVKSGSSKITKGLLDYFPQNSREWALAGAAILKAAGLVASAVEILYGAPILGGIGVVSYVASELTNSDLISSIGIGVGSGSFAHKPTWNGGLGVISSAIGGVWYKSIMANIDVEIQESLKQPDLRPYQIELSTYYLKMPYDQSKAIIHVNTLSPWEIEQGDRGWVIAKKIDDGTIEVEIKEPNKTGSRYATFIVCAQNGTIPCVSFTVEQIGIEYTIEPRSLTFKKEGGESGFTVSVKLPATVESIEVYRNEDKSWCHVTTQIFNTNAIVKVDPNEDDKARNTLILVNFNAGESKFSTTVSVSQEGKEEETGFFAETAFYNTAWNVTIKENYTATGTRRKYNIATEKYYTEPFSEGDYEYEYSMKYSFHDDQIDLSITENGATGTESIYIVNNQLYYKEEEGALEPMTSGPDLDPIFISIVNSNEIRWTSASNTTINGMHSTYNMNYTYKITDDKISGNSEGTYISQYVGSNPEYTGTIYYKSVEKVMLSGSKTNYVESKNSKISFFTGKLKISGYRGLSVKRASILMSNSKARPVVVVQKNN
jgi:hypothetical protein